MSEKITKVVVEWDNGDRRTFENAEGLHADKLKQARRLLTEGDTEEKAPAKIETK